MSTVAEIETAIEKLAPPQVEEIAGWLEALRARRATPPHVETWLRVAQGVARPGVTTASVMAMSREAE